jgi:DMSO/TMAO reductase YedYZ molybdopterin-dependent catalytic subunit
MNGTPLPMLNGFPVRLVVPGWYATYWVKTLSQITLLDAPLRSFWMDKAYRIPHNTYASEAPDKLATDTVPINRIGVHSIFVVPEPGGTLRAEYPNEIQGLAQHGGQGIGSVDVSVDGGRIWNAAKLDDDLGQYSWRRWRFIWTPPRRTEYRLMVRATASNGETQQAEQWNRSGYQRSTIEHITVRAI